jgi:hypothetical protein
MDEEKLIIRVQGHECLYNLQQNDYDNNLVKDNCWKEIAGEWQGRDRFAAGERHGMCEWALTRLRPLPLTSFLHESFLPLHTADAGSHSVIAKRTKQTGAYCSMPTLYVLGVRDLHSWC